MFRRGVDGDVAGAFQYATVDLHITGEQQACTAITPALVECGVASGGMQIIIGYTFGHRGFAETVWQRDATRKGEGLVN